MRKRDIGLLILALLWLPQSAVLAASYEQPPSLSAKDVFPGVSLKGDRYTVEPSVPTDGFLTRAVIKSDFGDFVAIGPGMLKTRLHEIDALEKLETFEASEEFQKGAKDSANEKWESLKQVYDKPKEAVAGISAGVGRFFKRSYRAAKTGVQTVGDVVHDRAPGVEEGEGANLPGKTQTQALSDDKSKYEQAAKASGSAAVNILGFSDARRKLAKRLGVDPYTTNPVLDERLDEITWSIFAGNFGIDVATSLIPGAIIVTTSGLVTSWVWDTPPGDLRVKIEETLKGINISQEDIDRLLRHRAYPLSYQAALTAALKGLGEVEGHEKIMPLALSVTGVDQARFLLNSVRMLQRYHETVKPLANVAVLGTVFGTDKSGRIVVTAPADYVSWSADLDKFSAQDALSAKNERALYIAGRMSNKAKSTLEKRGWVVRENSDLFVVATAGK